MRDHAARYSRVGHPVLRIPHRQFDTGQRDAVAASVAAEPAWPVLDSLRLRRFTAFPRWSGAPIGLVVRDATSSGLAATMRLAEIEVQRQSPGLGWPQ